MVRRASLTAALLLFLTLPLHAVITGRVLDEDGKPLKGVRVRVRALEPNEVAIARMLSKDPQPQWLNSVETNDSGAFRIDTKSNGVVDLMIDAAGREYYEQDLADGDDAGTFVLRKSAASRGRVTANGKGVAGALVVNGLSSITRTDADGFYETQLPDLDLVFGRISVIHPDYAIVDRPFRDRDGKTLLFDVALKAGSAVRGRVVDAAGRPVAGATVRCTSCVPARSGDDGSFEIAHAPVEKPALYAREGNRAGVLFAGGVKPPFVIQLRPAAALSGTVRSSKDDSPVPGARVTVRTDYADPFAPSAISDAKGNFTIDGLDATTRRVTVTHPNFYAINEQRFEPGTRTSRILIVTPYARLSGRVVDDDQKPVAAARVRVAFGGFAVMTAPDGAFSLRLPFFDRGLQVSVQKPSFPLGMFGPYSLGPGETKNVQFRLASGYPLEIRLIDRDGAPVQNEPVDLFSKTETARYSRTAVPCGASGSQCRSDAEGRVSWRINEGLHDISAGGDKTVRTELPNQMLNARSSPLTITLDRGATIEGRLVWSDGTPANLQATVTTLPSADTGQATDGVFTLRVPAGKHTLVAEVLDSLAMRSEPVEVVAPATGVMLKFPRYGRIEGRVADRENDKAVPEFSISVSKKGSYQMLPPKQFRAGDGRFVIDDVAPGAYDLRVQAYGFSRANTTAVTVEEAKAATAAIQLDRGARLIGRATSEGRPLADVQISAAPDSDWRSRPSTATTDSNGEYTIDGVAPGAQRFEARRSGYVTKPINVTLEAGQETRADVELSRGRELLGRVIDTTGRPLPQTNIGVSGSRDFPGSTVSDTDGAFKLTGLADTPISLTARKDGFAEQKVDVNPATTSDVTITLDRGGTITGRILGVAQSDLPFVEVRVSYSNTAQVDSQGAFTITGLKDGEQYVMATLTRPRRRDLQARVTVAGGTAPPVELDFSAGISVHGKVTQKGELVEGSIMFMPSAPGPQTASGGLASGGIGRDGTYEVHVSAPGEYAVRVSRAGGMGMIETGRVNVAGEMTHDIELRGATVTGTVVDAVTHQPIGNASVMMMPGSEVRTNNAGKFSFDLVIDGKYRLRAQTSAYAPELRTIDVANGVAPELEIALVRGVEARFRFIDGETGQLVEPPYMMVADASHMSVYGGQVPAADANGVRSLLLQPGTYEIRCGGPGVMYKPVTLTVPSPLLDVRLEPVKR